MSPLGQVHLLTALIALASGAWVLLRRKGTARHRQVGWLYVASMLALNVTALLIYRLTGTFGPFHFAALISLATLLAGVVNARRRLRGDRNWLRRHYSYMTWSYLGLAAAAVAETATRAPAFQAVAGGPTSAFWIAVVVASVAVFAVGATLIRRKADVVIRPFLNR
jgi:uncharacterized membrane protein